MAGSWGVASRPPIDPSDSPAAVTIVPDWDFELHVQPNEDVLGLLLPSGLSPCCIFKVKKDILTAKTKVLLAKLGPHFAEGQDKKKADIVCPSPVAVQILLQVLHDVSEPRLDAYIPDLWHILALCDFYMIKQGLFGSWFDKWADYHLSSVLDGGHRLYPYSHRTDGELELDLQRTTPIHVSARQLLFPAFTFGCAETFRVLTHHLVYEADGHITEWNPTQHKQLHLPFRVIQQLNSARGRIRNVLQQEIGNIIGPLFRSSCNCYCKMDTAYIFQRQLTWLGMNPFAGTRTDKSLRDIIYDLGGFRNHGSKTNCSNCNQDWAALVNGARKIAHTYFDGLCIDCMNMELEVGDVMYEAPGGEMDPIQHDFCEWDLNCRIYHNEPTYYYSYMCRSDRPSWLLRKDRPKGTCGCPVSRLSRNKTNEPHLLD